MSGLRAVRNVLVTAGPTREFLDPVRFISNRSSGRMGYAIAAACARRGLAVTLVSGPVALEPPAGVACFRVVTAEEMCRAVLERLPAHDALVMVAAVADWRPRAASAQKLKKGSMAATLELEPTPDILRAVAPVKGDRVVVGFAAETEHVEAEARRKLREKGLDGIVANDVSRADRGMESNANEVWLISARGGCERVPLADKGQIAERVVEWMLRLEPAPPIG
jgi:phosphopantothenoylcysteine decarboxylase / phosphopantothenate---cysteine ligase